MAATNPDESGWAKWLQEQLDLRGWQDIDLSKRSGGRIASSQMTRWLNNGRRPDKESVRKVCTVLKVPRVQGMIAAGYIDPDDIGATVVEAPNLASLTRTELIARGRALLEELAARIPDDDTSVEDPMPLRRRVVPVVAPEGVKGRDWAASDPRDWGPDETFS